MDKSPEHTIEELGNLVDTIDNYLALQQNHLMPLQMRLDSAKAGLEAIREKVLSLYTGLGGEDVWGNWGQS